MLKNVHKLKTTSPILRKQSKHQKYTKKTTKKRSTTQTHSKTPKWKPQLHKRFQTLAKHNMPTICDHEVLVDVLGCLGHAAMFWGVWGVWGATRLNQKRTEECGK